MADVKISGLPASSTPLAGTEVLPIVQGGVTDQVSVANLTAGRAVSALSLALTTPLAVSSGGTGLSSLTANYIPYGNGTSALNSSASLTFDGNYFVIGNTAANYSMGVTRTGANPSSLSLQATTSYATINFGHEVGYFMRFYSTTTSTEVMRIFGTGGVCIGNTTDKGAGSLNVSGLIYPQQAATISAPSYVKGAIYFDTTLNKLRVGGATAWETITSV